MDGDGNIISGNENVICPNLRSFRTLTWDEFVVLGAALKEFNGKKGLFLTVTLLPEDDPSNLNNLLQGELKDMSSRNEASSGNMEFYEKAVQWVKRKLETPFEIPKNGLAIFAGVISHGRGPNKTLMRVLIQFEPGFTSTETSLYKWRTLEFLPECLLESREITEKHKRYGIISISATSVAMGIYDEFTHVIEYCNDQIDFNERPDILLDTLAPTAKMIFIDPDPSTPPIVGLIVGLTGGLNEEGRLAADCALTLIDPKLKAIMSQPIQCDGGSGGIAGIKEVIEKGKSLLEDAWDLYIKNLASHLWLLPTSDAESKSEMDRNGNKKATLIETMRELGIGISEQIEVLDGCFTKKNYTDYSVK